MDHILEFTYNAILDPSHPLDEYGRTPLHYAVHINALPVLQSLLYLQLFPINHRDCLQHTALYRAMQTMTHTPEEQAQLQQIVYTLLWYGADPNAHHPADPSPLMLAVLKQDEVLIEMLLTAKANVNTRLETEGLLFRSRESAVSLATRLHTMIPTPICEHQLYLLGKLLLDPRVCPTVVFHALQQTKDPMLRSYILRMNSLNPTPPIFH